MTALPESQLTEDLATTPLAPVDLPPGESTPHGAAAAVPGQPRRLRFRRPGLSLASFPAALYAFLPYTMQARLVPGSVMRQVLSLAWPSVLEQSLVTLIGLVDAYIVGHLGTVALAGVGMGGQVLNLTAAAYGAVGVGGTALVARHMGAREPGEANQLARQAVLLAFALGALTALACFSLAQPIMRGFGAAPDVVSAGALWLRVVAPSFLFLGVLLVGTAVLRGGGDTRTPLLVMLAVNVVNVAVAWTFTRGLFGLPNLGIAGSALGAMSGHTVGGLVVLWLLVRGRGHLKLGWQVPRPDLGRLRRILNIGLPAGAEQVLLQLALVNLAIVIAQLGTAAYAAHQVGLRIAALSFLPGWGFSVAATTLVGQELGARNPERARRATYTSFGLALAVMSSMAVLLFAFADPILRLFTDDMAVIAAGRIVIKTSAVIQPMMAATFVFSGALRGAGDTRATMVITVGTIWGLRLAAAYVLGVLLGLGLFGAWLGVGIDFAVRSLLFWLRFRTGRWAHLRI